MTPPAITRRAVPLWPLVAVAGAVIVGTARFQPVLPVVIVIGIVLVAIAAFRPKAFVVLGLSVIALTVVLQRVGGEAASHADEAVVLISVAAFCTRRLVAERRLVWLPGGVPLLLFVVAGVLSTLVQQTPLDLVLPTVLTALKSALYAFALAQLRWSRDDLRLLLTAGGVAAGITLAVGLINLGAPNLWSQLTRGTPAQFYGPLPALNGAFQHPAAMSRWCALLATGAAAWLLVVHSSARTAVVAVVASVLSVLTLEVKSIIGLVAALAFYGIRAARPAGVLAFAALAPLGAVVLGPIAVSLVASTVQTYVLQESARLRLTQGALDLAAQHFPLGAGFGRWGSTTAATEYSPLYLQAGFEDVSGLSPRSSDYLNDTQWPAVLGEAGWLGTAMFVLAILLALRVLTTPVRSTESVYERWIRLAGIGWVLVLVAESIAAPVFNSTPSYPFLFLATGIVASLRADGSERAPEPRVPAVARA